MKTALIGTANKTGALTALARMDADINNAVKQYGPPPDRTLPHGFATLARIIIGQQISTLAAASVWERMQKAELHKSAKAHKARLSTLRKAGLSQMKAEYVKGLATAIEEGQLDLKGLAKLPGEVAAEKLTALRGIGEWTADNYRLFVLLDMDAWPYNDLAMQEGMKILKSLKTRPDGKTMSKMGKPWQPYRGAGALMLWHVYACHRRAASVADI